MLNFGALFFCVTSWSSCSVHRAVSAPGKGQLSLSIGDFASPQTRSDTTGPSPCPVSSPLHPGLSCPAFQAIRLLGENEGSWSHIPALWSDLVIICVFALVKEVLNWFVCFAFFPFSWGLFSWFFLYFTQLHLSSPWGCLKQEAQLQTPSKFRPILSCGLNLPLSLSFPLKTIQEAALTRTQTSPPHLLLSPGAPWPLSPPAPPKHYRGLAAG